MNKKQFILSLLLCTLLLPLFTGANVMTDPKLYINSPTNRGDKMLIQYEVNMPGFVELHLFDKEGEKIWIKGKVTDRIGQDYIAIPRKPLKIGDR